MNKSKSSKVAAPRDFHLLQIYAICKGNLKVSGSFFSLQLVQESFLTERLISLCIYLPNVRCPIRRPIIIANTLIMANGEESVLPCKLVYNYRTGYATVSWYPYLVQRELFD